MKFDTQVLLACQRGDRKATERLYELCFHTFMPLCAQYHRNEEDARASLNICFVKIIQHLPELDLEHFNFYGWSRRIMNNTLIDEYRKNKRYNTQVKTYDSEAMIDFQGNSSLGDSDQAVREEDMLKMIDTLPEVTKIVFLLYAVEGYSHKEIGEKLDMAEGTSKWHLSNARKHLKERLDREENKIRKMVI